jgi:hypothetical protein
MANLNPNQLAELGEKLYEDVFREEYASGHSGEFLAIDVDAKTAFVGKSVEEALLAAKTANESGFFHVVRIGAPGVYKVSFGRSNARGWLFR